MKIINLINYINNKSNNLLNDRISSIILNNPSGFLDSFVSTMGFKFLESFIKLITGKSQRCQIILQLYLNASGISILGLYHIFICLMMKIYVI